MPVAVHTERLQLGNYLGQSNLEQMLLGLQSALGNEAISKLTAQVGEKLGRATVRDWQLGSYQVATEQLSDLLEASLGRQGHSLCRVQHVYVEQGSYHVIAKLPQYALMRVLTSNILLGMLSELVKKPLGTPEIRSESLLLSKVVLSIQEEY